jgi:SAM-dependent methyltransferase
MDRTIERSLHRLFLSNGEHRIHKWVHYFDVYERHFRRFVDRKPTVLEIGVAGGGSLRMWKEYFGEGSRVIGIDIDPACRKHECEGIEIFIGSQDDPALLDRVLEAHDAIDIVIDDGSHQMKHLRATFEQLYHRISPFGLYLLEDLHTCYWEQYGGGLNEPASFMEFTKQKLDEINAVHTRGAVPPTRFTAETAAICVYDSIVVFERAPQGRRQAPMTERMPLA